MNKGLVNNPIEALSGQSAGVSVTAAGSNPMAMLGRVPLSLSSDQKALTQPERSVTYRFVVGELQACAPLLTARMSQHEGYFYGKFNQDAAYFLLAKLALNAEVYADDDWTDGRRPDGKDIFFEVDGQRLNAWQTALAYCRKVEALGYRLEPDYTANFSITNEVSAENIFTIPMDKTLYTNVFNNLFRSRPANRRLWFFNRRLRFFNRRL